MIKWQWKRLRLHASQLKKLGIFKAKLADTIDTVEILIATMSYQFCINFFLIR